MRIRFLLLFFVFLLGASFCKPDELSNACDPRSDSFLKGSIVRFLLNDITPSCLPGFPKVYPDIWGVHSNVPSNVEIHGIAVHDNKLYIGGSYSYFGPNTGGAAIVNPNDGNIFDSNLCPNLEVLSESSVAISDEVGGFYLGGLFTYVQGKYRPSVVHINANCKVDENFDVGSAADGVSVNDLALFGDRVYIAGNFTIWNGAARGYLAAVDKNTGALDPNWIPNANSPVNTLLTDSDGLFVGGQFTTINGGGSPRLAKVNFTTGANVPAFATGVTGGAVIDIALGTNANNQKVLYAVGSFQTGPPYNARAFLMDGTEDPNWDPAPNALTHAVAVVGTKVFLAGSFTTVNGGTARNTFAAVDNNTGIAGGEDLSLSIGQNVTEIVPHNGKLYILGNITTVFGFSRLHAFAVDPSNGLISDWNPRFTTSFTAQKGKLAFSSDGTKMLIPGGFSSVNIIERNGFGSIDLISGRPTDFAPAVNGTIFSMHLDEDILYAGGNFTQAFGETRNGFFAYNLKNNRLEGMAPGFTPTTIRSIASDADSVYVGGEFTQVSGNSQVYSVKFPLLNGSLTSWNPDPDGFVRAILPIEEKIIMGGEFANLGGGIAGFLGTADKNSGLNLSYPSASESPNNSVYSLATHKDRLFFGGNMSFYGPNPVSYFGSVNLSDTSYLDTKVTTDSTVLSIGICKNGKGGFGGFFSQVNGVPRGSFVLYDFETNRVLDFNPVSIGAINTTFPYENTIFFAGSLSEYNRRPKGGFYFVNLEDASIR